MEFIEKARDLKRGLPRFRHRLAEHCRRLFAVVICASLILSGFPSGFFQAFAADEGGDYVFELDRASLYEALDTAIADGTTLDSELRFLGDYKEEYDELFEPDGTLYELEDLGTDKDRERDKNVELRVFVRIEGDISLDEAYEADGTEEVLFLLSNKTDDEISVRIVLDDRETEVIIIPAAKDIPAEIDKDLLDEELEEIPETVELEAISGAAGGAGAGTGAAGDGVYVDDEAQDEDADEEAAAEDAADVEDEEGFDSDAAEEDSDSESAEEGPDKESEAGSDERSDREASLDDNSDADTGSDAEDSSEDKGSSHDRGFSGGRGSSEDKESSDKESSEDKDDSKDEGSSSDKEFSGEDSSKGKGSDRKDSSRSRGSSEKHSDDSSKEEKTASISINKNTLLMSSVALDYTEAEPEANAAAEEAASPAVEESDIEGSDDAVIIAASPSNASPSNASPSDASKIIDGTVYEPVRLGNRGAVAFVTTAEDLGLTEDLDMITTLTYEGEDFIVTVSYGKDAGLPRDVELFASEYDKDSDTFQERLAEVAEFNDWDESRLEEKVVYDDENDDEGHLESIVDRIRLFNVSLNSDGPVVEPEAEVEVQISLLNSEEPGENGGCYSVFHFADTDIEALDPTNEYEDAVQTITFSVSSFSDIMLLDDADPHFTVQFYANIDQILKQHKEGDTDLTVIETHTDNGAVLPSNNGSSTSNYNTSVVELKSDGSGGFKLDSENVLTEMYSAEAYEFVLEPDLHSMNKLEVNSDYTLKQIWVLKDSKDSTSLNESDWDIYNVTSTQDPSTGEYSYNISFTNNSSEASSTTIYIAEGSVFRFVYDPTPSDAYVTVNMYDYNVADGNVYAGNSTSSGTWSSGTKYLYVNRQGINSESNYSGSGVALGFGNNNVGTGLETLYWGDNQLNKYNNNGLLGCTFGIPNSLNDQTITYSGGITAPKLFGDGDATGKQMFSNVQLTFDREGDTYTLKAISGDSGSIALENLDTFTNPGSYTSIFTNNFWPLDKVSYTGMDPLFGGSSSVRYFGIDSDTGASKEGNMPTSDDGTDHNSYFGMNFDIEFSYTKDYIGPLEYFFFGDDDMWVFLDGELVLDIGGVHSSVGEHVDLWDYLESERGSLQDGETAYHTLSIYYTERGASGSTCYISYTLPTVSSVTPVDNSGSLRVDKQVVGTSVEEGKEFTFTVNLADEDGNALTNLYNSIVYTDDEENEVDNSYLVTNGSTLALRDGWHFVIHNLPVGTVAMITETAEDGFSTTWQVVAPTVGDIHGGTVASGDEIEISNGGITEVLFVNTAGYILPATGGRGKYPFQIAGALMLVSSAILLYELLRRRRLTIRK